MKNFLIACGLALFLAGCQTTQNLVVEKMYVPQVPEEFWNCPVVKKYPQVKTLTDRQVAELINVLANNNRICSNNMNAVRNYLIRAGKISST